MIQIKGLNKTYGRRRGDNRVLRDVSLTLPDTGFVCILGPSGCGKTSLINAIGGLDRFDNGTISTEEVTVDRYGKALFEAERNRNFGYIFQNYYLLPEHSVGYNVYLGLHSLQLSHEEKLDRVEEALKAVEMERYFYRNVADLSGGQQQRVAIARALARKPRVIFADEPTGNLDEANTRNICTLLRKISKTSLVVMVTHEQRIAQFFADRIISLQNGVIARDEKEFERGTLTDTAALYTGDFAAAQVDAPGVRVKYYRQEAAPELEVSIVALKDRIVIKLNDGRMVVCGKEQDQPLLVEGKRPEFTLEDLEQGDLGWKTGENVLAKAGKGLGFRDLFREALHMSRQKGLRNWGTRLFLLILTVLTALSVADFIALSRIDPEDFITSHSQVLEVSLKRGSGVSPTEAVDNQVLYREFIGFLEDSGQKYYYVPKFSTQASVSGSVLLQAEEIPVYLQSFSYVPMDFLQEDTLLLGRMPSNGSEVAVDRWVLDAILEQDGVAQNGITGLEYFLGKKIRFRDEAYAPTIVGICDSGEPAVYMMDDGLVSLGPGGLTVASLSSLQAAFPGVYDDVVLESQNCMVIPENAGLHYYNLINGYFRIGNDKAYRITQALGKLEFYPKIIVADQQVHTLLMEITSDRFYVYCADKAAMTAYLNTVPEKMEDRVTVSVYDRYAETLAAYQHASQLRADARVIVTATVILLSMVMLYLLRRSQVHERIGMLSVYRLLGIPKRKALGIFCMESLMGCLLVVLPTAVGTWAVLSGLNRIPETQTEMLLPLQAALLVGAGIAVFYVVVTVIPLYRLLRIPPAQLAAKFDF